MTRATQSKAKKARRARRKVDPLRPRPQRVDNPYFAPEHPESPSNPKTIMAMVNPRESAVETLYARRFLGTAQKKAADRFRATWEAAGGKTAALDYSQDRVDGSAGDPVTGRLQAIQELRRCRYLLGQRGYDTIEAICGEGQSMAEMTPHKRERLTLADNLRADLDDLATMWGLQTGQRDFQRKRA